MDRREKINWFPKVVVTGRIYPICATLSVYTRDESNKRAIQFALTSEVVLGHVSKESFVCGTFHGSFKEKLLARFRC